MTDENTGIIKTLKPVLILFIILWVITGIIYPLAVYVAGQLIFPWQAQGSLIYDKNGGITGSKLIGQEFSGQKYFWPRPSATAELPYNPLASSGSNLGPTSRKLMDEISNRTEYMMNANGASEIPSDIVMASASGLDPHISIKSAQMQAPRVAKARGIELETVNKKIQENTEEPVLGILGEERVNVLLLNKALDNMQ
jgi:K+-transporting ATPase ATPase C chain